MANIVVCDDEPHIVQGLRYLFESDGHDVRVAHNGLEALELIADECPDLLVTDIMMPKLSGFELVRRIRADVETRSLPVLMLTAKGQRSDAVYAREVGATEFVTKPFSPIKLRELVRWLVGTTCETVA